MIRNVITFCALIGLSTTALALKTGDKAPDFKLTDTQGATHSLSAQQGKWVVLEWYNPTCPFVVRHYEKQTMTKLASEFGAKGVQWFAVDSSHFVTANSGKDFEAKHSIKHPVLLDADGTVGRKYGAKTTPHMYVIDPSGVLRYMGAIDDDPWGDKTKKNYVRNALTDGLAGKSIQTSETKPYGCSVKYKSK